MKTVVAGLASCLFATTTLFAQGYTRGSSGAATLYTNAAGLAGTGTTKAEVETTAKVTPGLIL